MALFKCNNGNAEIVENFERGRFDARNRTDSSADPKYITVTLPVKAKPRKFFVYKSTGGIPNYVGSPAINNHQGDNSWGQETACFYDEDISTTQYYVQNNDANCSVLNRCKMYNIGSTYDWTPIRTITSTEITMVFKVAYYPSSGSTDLGFKWYGGQYYYWIVY